jgi:uncharacterized membrane protein
LLGGGVALLFLAAYGAYGFHHLVPAPMACVFLLGVAVAGALLALQRNSYAVALLTFDLSVLETGYRIASFLGVGIVLLAISVLYQRERRT